MRHIVHTNADGYVVSLELTQDKNGIEVPEEVFYSPDLTCYKYVEGAFVFDEEKRLDLLQRKCKDSRKKLKSLLPKTWHKR